MHAVRIGAQHVTLVVAHGPAAPRKPVLQRRRKRVAYLQGPSHLALVRLTMLICPAFMVCRV